MNKKGFGIVQAVIAVAIGSLSLLYLHQFVSTTMYAQRYLDVKSDVRGLRITLQNSVDCSVTLAQNTARIDAGQNILLYNSDSTPIGITLNIEGKDTQQLGQSFLSTNSNFETRLIKLNAGQISEIQGRRFDHQNGLIIFQSNTEHTLCLNGGNGSGSGSSPPTTIPLGQCIAGVECDPVMCIKDSNNAKNMAACYGNDCVWDNIDRIYRHEGDECVEVVSR